MHLMLLKYHGDEKLPPPPVKCPPSSRSARARRHKAGPDSSARASLPESGEGQVLCCVSALKVGWGEVRTCYLQALLSHGFL